MKLYYNLATGVLGAGNLATKNVAKIIAKRYSDLEVEILPVAADGTAGAFAEGSSGLLVVKAENDFSGAAKILDAAWDAPAATGAGYIFRFAVAGAGLDADLGAMASKTFGMEIVVAEPATETSPARRLVLPTVQLAVENNYYREDEPVPADPDPPYPLPGELVTAATVEAAVAAAAAAPRASFVLTSPNFQWQITITDDGQFERTKL